MILVIRIFPRATGIVAVGGSSKDFGGKRSLLRLGEKNWEGNLGFQAFLKYL